MLTAEHLDWTMLTAEHLDWTTLTAEHLAIAQVSSSYCSPRVTGSYGLLYVSVASEPCLASFERVSESLLLCLLLQTQGLLQSTVIA